MQSVILNVGKDSDSRNIAVRNHEGDTPGLVWLGGYCSDMLGTKAEALDGWAKRNGYSFCRHDYSGHGESEGTLMKGTISYWLEESLAVFDHFTRGPQILIGSSMGGWIALRMVQELMRRGNADRLHGLLMLAPAPDFTHEFLMPSLSSEQKAQLKELGYIEKPSDYSDEPYVFTQNLLEDGNKNRVMTGPIQTNCPVRIIQGMKDKDVPYEHAMKLLTFLPGENVTLTFVKDGDHRLSQESDIELILHSVEMLTKYRQVQNESS